MPDITLTMTADHIQRYITYRCAVDRYDVNKLAGETQAQFAKRMLIRQEQKQVKAYENGLHSVTESAFIKTKQDEWEVANPAPVEITIT